MYFLGPGGKSKSWGEYGQTDGDTAQRDQQRSSKQNSQQRGWPANAPSLMTPILYEDEYTGVQQALSCARGPNPEHVIG